MANNKYPTPSQIAECGGPCLERGRDACDCGLREYGLPPLWQVMRDAFCDAPGSAEGYAAELRAIADALENNQSFLVDGYNLSPEGKAIAAWLLTEADRAEAGE